MRTFTSLASRVAVAVPGIGLFVIIALVDNRVLTAGFFAAVSALAAAEALLLLNAKTSIFQRAVGGVLGGGATLAVSLMEPAVSMPILLIPGSIMSFWWVMSQGIEGAKGKVAGSIGMLTLISVGFGLLARFRLDFESPWVLFIPLMICWIADSMAYFVGSAFGRHKLAPGISPAKSWEGFYAGLAGAVAGALISGSVGAGFPVPMMVITGILAGKAAVIGDFLESAMKRDAGVKDSGCLLPGHGGVLDRFDSVLAVVPVVWILLMLHETAGLFR